tara:strand:+ start:17573 stop:18211 length:639 start_codon:yes stop_codon:yes gene_type:complete
MGLFDDLKKKAEETFNEAKKSVNNVVREVGKGTQKIGSIPLNAVKEVERSYNRNQAGINATAGLAARGAAAYFTGGASEALGAGDLLTKQFGGAEDTAALGDLVGLASGGQTALAAKLFQASQAQPQNYVMDSQGGYVEGNWYDDFLDIGKDYVRQQALGGGKDRKVSLPSATPQPAVITVPAPQQEDNTTKYIIAGVAGLALVGIAFAYKR